MKKTILFKSLLLVLTAAMLPQIASAQSFEFRYHGESLADGATVTIVAEEEWGEMCCHTNPSSDPNNNGLILQVMSGNVTQGTATMTIDENNLNPARILWCMGGSCMVFGSNTSLTKPFWANNGICQVQFDADDIQCEGHLLATLTATIGGETHTVKIKFANGVQPATGITLSESSHTLQYNGNDTFSFQLTATVTPSNATYSDVSWTSSNANVATVSSDGTVTSAGLGTTTITATTTDGTNLSALCVVTVLASAYDFKVDGLCYKINSDGTSVTVTYEGTGSEGYGYSNLSGSIDIPPTVTYNGTTYSVTSIDIRAFYGCSSLSSVTIGNSVTEIGSVAFEGCSGLTSVNIPNSVTWIGVYAFRNCSGLTSMVVESGNTKYDSRNNCNAIIETSTNTLIFGCMNTIIPNSVTSIGISAFNGCSGLTSVTIPNSVTTIGSSAFNGCSGLTSVTIPNSVTTIGSYAFNGCSGLTSVTIPNSVTSIGAGAFWGCTGLTSMVVESGNTKYDSRNNCNAIIKTDTNILISGCKNTIIPNSVTSIGYDAFSGCTGLTSVTIPNSVTSIGDYAFYGCTGLTSVTIPNSVTTIYWGAFQDCSSLSSVTIGNSVTTIEDYAFSGCNGLANIYCEIFAPLSIEENVFSNYNANLHVFSTSVSAYQSTYPWNKFNIVTIVQPVSSISLDQTSASIYQNETLTLSATVLPSTASNPTLSWSSSDTNVATVDQNGKVIGIRGGTATITATATDGSGVSTSCVVTVIGIYDFKLNGLCYKINNDGTSVTVTYEKISNPSYSNLSGAKTIPASVTYGGKSYSVTAIGNRAFKSCTGLTSVTIGNSVISIGESTFQGCSGLTSVTIGNSVTSIGSYAFNGCTGLTSVTIGNSVISIGESTFEGCSGLTSVTMPNSVTSIGINAFNGCSGLTKVNISDIAAWCNIDFMNFRSNPLTFAHNLYLNDNKLTNLLIPSAVTTIKQFAFNRCTSLTSVTIPNSVTSIGDWAFESCTGLTSVTIPNSVTSIGAGAFWGCTGLTSVTIPNSVTSIGARAFYGCSGLTNIYSGILHPENVALGSNVFYGIDKSNCILTIPGGTLSLYQNAPQWKDFLNMVVYIGLSVAPDVAHVRGAEHRTHELYIDMNNGLADISGVQFLMALPTGVSLATDSYGYYDVWLDDDRRARNHSVSVEARSGNKYFVLISSPTNKTFSGNTGDILHMNIEIDQYHSAIGDYPITISNIILAEPDETQHNTSNAQSTVRMSYLVGDANADVEVDIADYVVTANHLLGHSTGAHFFTDAANANYTNNTTINVTDLVAITNIALELREKEIKPDVSGYQRAPALTMPGIDYWLTASVIENGSNKTVVAIAVDNDEPIAAMQLDLDLPEGITLESASVTGRTGEMSASCGVSPDGKARVVLSSFGTAEFDAGCGDVLLLTLSGTARQGELLQLGNVVMTERSLTEHGATGELMLDLNDMTGVSTVAYDHVNIYGSNGSVIIESPVEGMAQLARINGMSKTVKVEPGRNVYPVNVSHGDIIIATFNGVAKKIQF